MIRAASAGAAVLAFERTAPGVSMDELKAEVKRCEIAVVEQVEGQMRAQKKAQREKTNMLDRRLTVAESATQTQGDTCAMLLARIEKLEEGAKADRMQIAVLHERLKAAESAQEDTLLAKIASLEQRVKDQPTALKAQNVALESMPLVSSKTKHEHVAETTATKSQALAALAQDSPPRLSKVLSWGVMKLLPLDCLEQVAQTSKAVAQSALVEKNTVARRAEAAARRRNILFHIRQFSSSSKPWPVWPVSLLDGAVADLVRWGSAGVDALTHALRQTGVGRTTQIMCMRVLERIGAPAALPALHALTSVLREDTDPDKRVSAAQALGALGAPAFDALTFALRQDTSSVVRSLAARALGALGAPALDALTFALRQDTDRGVRAGVAQALGALGAPALDALTFALRQDTYSVVRLLAAQALGAIGAPAALPATITELVFAACCEDLDFPFSPSESHAVREHARKAISLIGPPAWSLAVFPLVTLLTTGDFRDAEKEKKWFPRCQDFPRVFDVTLNATKILVELGVPAALPAIDALVSAVRANTREPVRLDAVYALGCFGRAAGPSAEAALATAAAREHDNRTRRLVIEEALAKIRE